jgi:16S rRNA (uracil1498-N3)-methyltransferase
VSRARLIVAACPEAGSSLVITGAEAAHARALRLAPGDSVTLVDGTGVEAHGTVRRVTKAGLEVFVERVARASESEIDVTLLVSGLRPERLSWVAEKSTELSVRRLVVVTSERAQSFRASAAAAARLRRVVREAAKQCESARWPDVDGPIPIDEVWGAFDGHRLFFDFVGEPFPSRLTREPVALLIGPEGGWTEAEQRAAHQAGWRATSLPAGKLRAETAAVAAMVLVRAALARV